MVKVAIGLGSNMGERFQNLKKALDHITEEFLEDAAMSSIYESKPWGDPDQGDFLNAVMVGSSEWKPPAIVNFLKNVEREMGRTATRKFGPRLIDLDLLIYGEENWNTDGVVVPHPFLQERHFVLLPLQELWSNWRHPVLRKSVEELLSDLGATKDCRRWSPPLSHFTD